MLLIVIAISVPGRIRITVPQAHEPFNVTNIYPITLLFFLLLSSDVPESGCSSSHAITSFFLFQLLIHKRRVNSDKFDRRNKGQLTIWRSQLVGTRYSSRNSVEHPGPSKAFRRYRRIPVKHKFRFNWRIITGQDEAVAGKKMIGNR